VTALEIARKTKAEREAGREKRAEQERDEAIFRDGRKLIDKVFKQFDGVGNFEVQGERLYLKDKYGQLELFAYAWVGTRAITFVMPCIACDNRPMETWATFSGFEKTFGERMAEFI
jgi:hypothetical protein